MDIQAQTDSIVDAAEETYNKIAKRIQKGIKFLIAHHGADWHHNINLEFLDMKHADSCIVGQLHYNNDYNEAIKEYGIGNKIAIKFGFARNKKEGQSNRLLRIMWKDAIHQIAKQENKREEKRRRHWNRA